MSDFVLVRSGLSRRTIGLAGLGLIMFLIECVTVGGIELITVTEDYNASHASLAAAIEAASRPSPPPCPAPPICETASPLQCLEWCPPPPPVLLDPPIDPRDAQDATGRQGPGGLATESRFYLLFRDDIPSSLFVPYHEAQ